MNMPFPQKTATLEARMALLSARHGALEQRLSSEQKRPAPDLATLREIKRAKLRLKDEIASIEGVMRTLDRNAHRRLV